MDLKVLFVLQVSRIASSSQLLLKESNYKVANAYGIRSYTPDPDIYRNVTDLIRSKGYKCEDHTVQTKDGFILSMQRILPRCPTPKRRVMFLQHGLLDSSSTWVINQANESLGFILSDQGYEVWLGNTRGNTYSNRHTTYNKKDPQFWDWSFDEMITYDLPAMLTHATQVSKVPSVTYIGHSQGTMIGFGMLAKKGNESHQELIEEMIALAPVARVANIKGFFKILTDLAVVPEYVFKLLGINEFFPSNPIVKFIATHLCKHFVFREFCEASIYTGGLSHNNANASRVPVYLSHTPAGTSVKNLVHYIQMVSSKTFQMFDYKKENIDHYNKTYPPQYDLTHIRTPIHFFSGGQDELSDPQDVDWLKTQLPNVKSSTFLPEYCHLDFIWGMNACRKVYNKVLDILQD